MKYLPLLLALTVSGQAAVGEPAREPVQEVEQQSSIVARLNETLAAKTLRQIIWACGEAHGDDVDGRRACYSQELAARARGGENAYEKLKRLASVECGADIRRGLQRLGVELPPDMIDNEAECSMNTMIKVLGPHAFEDMLCRGIPALYTKPAKELTTIEDHYRGIPDVL